MQNRARFRPSSEGAFTNIIFGTIVGVISGNYIFAEPLKEYFEHQQRLQQSQQQQKQQGAGAGSGAGAATESSK